MKYIACFTCLLMVAFSKPAKAQLISPLRSTDWSMAGYAGAIPSYSTVKNILDFGGNGNGTALNDLPLQNAIASLNGQSGVIYFPAGNFLFGAIVNLRSGLILRGAGSNNTQLLFNLGGLNHLLNVQGSISTTTQQITASIFKNESSLAIDDAATFQPGDYLKVYQNDSNLVTDNTALESVGQILRVDSISGNRLFLTDALRRNCLLTDSPRVRKITMVQGVGIECLKIKRNIAGSALRSNIAFLAASNCWVTGVESDSCSFAHVRIGNSSHIEVSNCFFHGAFSYGASGEGYGVVCEYTTGDCLIENNIFRHLRHAMLIQYGANGNVFDYNYSLLPVKSESIPNDLVGDIVLHGNYPYLNLFEGNISDNIFEDAAHGKNGPFNTFFRNRATSYGLVISSGGGDSTNIIGNEITGTGFGKGSYSLRGLGNFELANNQNNKIIPSGTDTITKSSFIYQSKPSFWTITSPWPSIGTPNIFNSGTNPARERYLSGHDLGYCLSSSPATYTFSGNGKWSDSNNWANKQAPPSLAMAGSQIIIDPAAGGQCVLDQAYTVNPGVTLTVATGKTFLIGGNLTLSK